MSLSAITRHKLRRWSGAIGVSVGTAVFSGAVGILVDALVRGGSLHWPYLAGFTAIGAVLSAGGAWLVTTVKSAVGISVAAMDRGGDTERYQDEIDGFARFGRTVFTAQTTVQLDVESTDDLPLLRARLRAALRTLVEIEHNAREIGLLFQGRHEIGFHLGRWLNQASNRIDLYSDARGGGTATHFAAVHLTPAIGTPPRRLDMTVQFAAPAGFTEPKPVSLSDLPMLLQDHAGQCMGLAVNLNGPISETGFTQPVLAAAHREGASAVAFLALPAPTGDPDAPGRQLAPSLLEYESTIATVAAVAKRMPAKPGLLFLKTPAVIPVALGRYLYGSDWIPMRHLTAPPGRYERFRDPGPLPHRG